MSCTGCWPGSEAATLVRSVTGSDGVEGVEEAARQLPQKRGGTDVQRGVRVCVLEGCDLHGTNELATYTARRSPFSQFVMRTVS